LLASCREFEEASISEFDVATPSCNNPASPTTDDIDYVNSDFNQEKEQANFNEFQKVLQELVGTEDPTAHHYSSKGLSTEIQFYPENSSLATVPEFDFSHAMEMSLSSSLTQAGTIDNGNELAQLVASLDPSEALVSGNGWPDPRGAAAHLQFEKPALALTPLHGSRVTMETVTLHPAETSWNNNRVPSSTVTLTLPLVTATSFEQPTGQLSGTTWPERVATFPVSHESSYVNSDACNGVHEDTALTNRPIIEEVQTRPSVIVAARSRKRAIEEETNNKDAALKLSDDDVSPAVLEKRRKGNERCKRYRMNKKEREAEEDAELEALAARNAFLREEEQRLTARKRKLQQAYLDLIRQKKIRFS